MPIRTVVAGLPRLLSDVVFEALHQPPELVVAATDASPISDSHSTLTTLLTPKDVHALVAGVEGVEDEMVVSHVAVHHPDLVVLALSIDGRQAWMVSVKTDLIPVDEVSPRGLRRSIRSAVEARV